MAPAKKRSNSSSSQKAKPGNKKSKMDSSTLDFDPSTSLQIDPDGDIILYTPERFLKNDKGEPATAEASFLVSSKHLKMVSSYFKTLLSERWSSGRALTANGVARVAITDCEPDTLLLILRIIHGQFPKVPRVISFQKLVDVALAADFFDCIDLIEIFALRWIDGLRANEPSIEWTPDIPRWIMVCALFGVEAAFTRITKIALSTGTGPLQIQNLPIPAYIKEDIDQRREEYLQRVLCGIETNLIKMVSAKGLCTDQCQAAYVGLVTQYLARHNIFFRLVPFRELPIKLTSTSLDGMSTSGICTMVNNFHPHYPYCLTKGRHCQNILQPWGENVKWHAAAERPGITLRKKEVTVPR